MGDSQAPLERSQNVPFRFYTPTRVGPRMNGRARIPSSRAPEEKIQNLRCAIKPIFFSFLLLPCASLSGSFFKRNHSGAQRLASLPTFQMSPHTATWPQWGATIGADEGPKLPCGLEKKGRRPSRPLDYCLGKPEISGAQDPLLLLLPLSLFCVKTPHTHSYHAPPSAAFPDNSHKIILLTHSRSSIQVFSHFPLSFHSAVAPCAPPPAIHSGPSPLGFPTHSLLPRVGAGL